MTIWILLRFQLAMALWSTSLLCTCRMYKMYYR